MLPSDNALVAPSAAAPDPCHSIDTAARREALLALLRSRHIPVSELDHAELLVLNCLHVSPPYVARTCKCENEIVLGRFLALLVELET